MTLLKKHLETEDFKRELIENEEHKKAPEHLVKRKIVIISNCLEAYAPSTYSSHAKKPKF